MQILNDHCKNTTDNHPLINKINQWERTSIDKIRQTANEQRQLVQTSIHGHAEKIRTELNTLTEEMQKIAKRKDFNELVLSKLRTQLEGLQKQLNQPTHIKIKEDSSSTYIKKLSIIITSITGKFICSLFLIIIRSLVISKSCKSILLKSCFQRVERRSVGTQSEETIRGLEMHCPHCQNTSKKND